MELAEKIYATVRLIPHCNLRRYVGNALHKNPSNEVTPCHRVVNAKGFCSGSFAFDGPGVQQEKLEAEGVIFVDGHVDMERFEITPDDFEMMRAGLVPLLLRLSKCSGLLYSAT
ncbi:MGMT family protein [Treponema berlinense]|uniref:MGMT family protein n=1 Tax=Treponema berlinense TaxID=225004 RepID=UPI0026ED4486|nr:MGMT family protein [Treponema berlinense]